MRESISTTRAIAVDRETATNRTSVSTYRLPTTLRDYGITNYWDFRNGYSGSNTIVSLDRMGWRHIFFQGTSTISSVYTAGEYQCNLVTANVDTFSTTAVQLASSALTKLSMFAWCKRTSVTNQDSLISQYNSQTPNSRAWLLRLKTDAKCEFIASNNGTTISTVETTTAPFIANQWYMVSAVFDNGALSIYFNKERLALNASLSTLTIHNPLTNVYLNALVNAAGFRSSTFGGNLGITGLAVNTAFTQTQIDEIYNFTNSKGVYR